MSPKLCLIEDDPIMGEALLERLELEGYECDWFQRGRDAVPSLLHKGYQVVISDIRLPDVSGEDLFVELREAGKPLPPFLFITGHGGIDQAVRLLKLGAEDYLTKPLAIPALLEKVRGLCQRRQAPVNPATCLGLSAAMRRIEAMLPRIAGHARTVLISGESGVGKDVVARAIHALTEVGGEKPFVAINCAAIPEQLIEAEMFGHEKGAFTGAVAARRGCFEQASGGTLFLDEIGEMPVGMQVKLLRVIQDRSVIRVGAEKEIPVDIRLICATNRDLKGLVETGRFREDLYYRIHVVHIEIPPLRERREDVLWLADRFLEEFSVDGVPRRLDHGAQGDLLERSWPGNVRELRHCLERACILSSASTLTAGMLCGDLGAAGMSDRPPLSLADHVAGSERTYILDALAVNGGRIADTAAQLGISRKNLWEKMRKLGIRAGSDTQ